MLILYWRNHNKIIPTYWLKPLTLKDIELLLATCKFVKYPQMAVAFSQLEFDGGKNGGSI